MSYYKTNRYFYDIETNEVCDLWMDNITHEFKLVHRGSEDTVKGSEVNGFYICAHSSVTIKINGKRQVHLQMGTFYHIKEGEKVTHKKYPGFKKFTKVK